MAGTNMHDRQGQRLGIGTVVPFGLVACLLYGIPAGLRGDIGFFPNSAQDERPG